MLDENDITKIEDLLKKNRAAIKLDVIKSLTTTMRGEFFTTLNSHSETIQKISKNNDILTDVFNVVVKKHSLNDAETKLTRTGEDSTDYIR